MKGSQRDGGGQAQHSRKVRFVGVHESEILNPSTNSKRSSNLSSGTIEECADVAVSGTKRVKSSEVIQRRSQRIRNKPLSSPNPNVEPEIERIEDSEGEEEYHCTYEKEKTLNEKFGEKCMEEKIEYLVSLLEEKEKTIESLKYEKAQRCFSCETPSLAKIKLEVEKNKFKSMYIDCQKKLGVLSGKNYQISKKLEIALGKLEAYEKCQFIYTEATDKLKDAILISVLGLSNQRRKNVGCASTAVTAEPAEPKIPTPKRKKAVKNGEK